MASLDFEAEKSQFREFHASNSRLLEDAKDSFITLLNALLIHAGVAAISKIEGRVKDGEECIRKFNRKYRTELESRQEAYAIRHHISDLIGIRIVCLYEDDIEKIRTVLQQHFEVIDVTDKIALIENTEGSFGYKGLHLDLKLNGTRNDLPEYIPYANFSFEVQIRTIIQDSWSVLDHKIKYKKSIPNALKRRKPFTINNFN
jgi:ppGpp synthetase/RelA/SpoT-type nucleotidyltranferase